MPRRYEDDHLVTFRRALDVLRRPDLTVLDMGSGRRPVIGPADRPSGWTYVGLDISAEELRLAPPGSYDESRTGDVVDDIQELHGRFDLILSWQVFEHVRPLDAAVDNLHRYLKPGGSLVAYLSGGKAHFALINRVVPHPLGVWAMHRLLGRRPESVFPAHYDRCTRSELTAMFVPWSQVEITPRFLGARYLRFLRPLQRAYLVYEDWANRRDHGDLATHYLVVAKR